jgi:DNA-directed RNA polymerase subunit L
MELRVVEKSDRKLKMELVGESHTFLNILTEYAWAAKASQAMYTIKHPYLSQPQLMVISENPKKTLSDAAQIIMDKAEDFEKTFERAMKK